MSGADHHALYGAIKSIILKTPRCPDSSGPLACASCLAQAIAESINNPQSTPMESVIGDIPVFSAKEVQSLINAAIIVDREECRHDKCARNATSGVVLVPL